MNNCVKWSYADEKISMKEIMELESVWEVKLPKAYVECAICNHGGSPEPEEFLVKGRKRVFGCLLSYCKNSLDNILEVYNGIKERLPHNIFPFGCDPAGNYICFDYRKSQDNPCIIFWEHELGAIESDYTQEKLKRIDLKEVQENAIKPISCSFKEFLESLL
ncbi:SMI1/KNR4 family protein [Tepidibacter hydrothermalis]|uniref:SMI1/KNR4 family protein n=1 Tax=Tepidibacter hydrothermalis TaxID=3036126 RepID=A0ABY8EAY2_9FIRM|nr:SMI1/KNR4 family protein [Tepidibacter hydrothermalis]WFD08954.1 SMI1/KNR4 family protein [Tepidibacter hydrothermalis]